MDQRQLLGRRGEEFAAAFLLSKGFHIIARNWRCSAGEIDLIVERGNELRFVEVKTRRTRTYGYPEEAITKTKLLHLRRAMEWWLRQHPSSQVFQVDVVAISILLDEKVDIHWVERVRCE